MKSYLRRSIDREFWGGMAIGTAVSILIGVAIYLR